MPYATTIEARQKAGIVGRTGAGKSSLVLALFRLVEPSSGTIRIDGHVVLSMPLDRLRRAITIIPQDPVLHQGSVAHNLDPFDHFDGGRLAECVHRAGLPPTIMGEQIAKGGSNLSSGERQLVCMARAMLRRRPILVMDEATASVDHATDHRIQQMVKRDFRGTCTVLTIAHRLHTVAFYDRILVLGSGEVLEEGAPLPLLTDTQGHLHKLAVETGDYDALVGIAREASA